MKSNITKMLFILLFFSAKMSPAAEMDKAENASIIKAIKNNKPEEKLGLLVQTRLLIKNNSDVNEKDKGGRTPLMYAAEKNKFDLISLLVDFKANVNATDQYGHSALCFAENQKMKSTLEKFGAEESHHVVVEVEEKIENLFFFFPSSKNNN